MTVYLLLITSYIKIFLCWLVFAGSFDLIQSIVKVLDLQLDTLQGHSVTVLKMTSFLLKILRSLVRRSLEIMIFIKRFNKQLVKAWILCIACFLSFSEFSFKN